MVEQLVLPGLEPRPRRAGVPTSNLFFAIMPAPAAIERIGPLVSQLRADHNLHGAALPSTRLHVSLHNIGAFDGVPHDIIARAIGVAATVAMRPFDIMFDQTASFSGRFNRPLVLYGGKGVDGLKAFRERLALTMEKAGLGRRTPFTPHMTLLYDEQAVANQYVEPVVWTATEFVLIRSLLRQSRYNVLGRWPKRG